MTDAHHSCPGCNHDPDDGGCNERYLTACHEAGHAVAALMRGGGELVSITIDQDTATQRAGSPAIGYTHTRAKTYRCSQHRPDHSEPSRRA